MILIFVLGLFVLVNIGVNQVSATDQETSTTVLADKGVVGSGDVIRFSIWTYAGFDSVPFGQIRLTDIFTGEFIETMITNGTAEVDWIVPSPIQSGEHLFLAEYLGFLGYLSSDGSCKVRFEEISPGSTRSTSLQLVVNSTTVYRNASLHFTLNLFIHYRWWFQGGYITVINVNLTGAPVIYTYGPLENYYPGTDPAILTLEFDYNIPVFSVVGKSQFYASYTGSSQSQTSPCTSNPVNVTVLSSGFWLYQTINTTKLQRTEESVVINTTILGDNPNGLLLSIYYLLGSQPMILTEKVIHGRNYQIVFSPNSSIPLGELTIYTELKNDQYDLYANVSSTITIQNRARIQYYLNSSDYRQNETIHLEAYITLEDIHTVPVTCQVEFRDLTDGNISLMNKFTNSDGYVAFNYPLPEGISIGNHEFSLRVFDVTLNILAVSSIILVSIKGLIEFDLTYESGGINRNTDTQIQVTVHSGGVTINEGLVSLEYSNSTIIDTQSCVSGLIFNYHIRNDHSLGDIYLLVHFYNSENYDEGATTLKLTVFSVPHFSSLNQNSTEVINGQSCRLWGYLLDEGGKAVINEAIHFTDTTTGEFLGFVTSDVEGLFFFDYSVTVSSQIGVHILQCSYQGNVGAFYLQSISPAIFSITIRPPLSVMIQGSILSNHWTMIELEGGLNEDISLYWQRDGESTWNFIAVIALNASGLGNYNWTTPYYKGGLSLRASNLNGTNTKYDHTFMYSTADIEVIGGDYGNVNDNYLFTVNCTEVYQIWMEGQLWRDWSPAGKHSYSYSFNNRGVKEISIISNDTYVYYRILHSQVTIFEDLIISVSIPGEAFVNMSIHIDGNVIGEVSGPIMGVDTILLMGGMENGVDSTNGAGIFDFIISFDQPGIYTVSVKVPLQFEDYFNTSFSPQFSIVIHSLPSTIEILSPVNNSIHGSILELSFRGDAVSYWYFIEPLDQTNSSWTDTAYRDLPEGLYTCHVYGENSYGFLSYASSSFRIDSTAPSLVIISPKNESYKTNSISLSFLTDEETVFIFLDDTPIVGSSGFVLTDLSEGNHNVTIQVRDTAENFVIKTSIFNIDTIAPSLTIFSPYNYTYIEKIPLSINSDGQTILYCIPEVNNTNQTYTTSLVLYLPIGSYSLNAYSFDSAGNFISAQVNFSVVEKVDLLTNSYLTEIDSAGNYLLSTEILSNPYFEQVGIYLNGSHFGVLEWDAFQRDYRIQFQFPSPGLWEISLYAHTAENKYDFRLFLESWYPPQPTINSLSVSWKSTYYELRTTIDSQTLDLNLVQVTLDGMNYSLSNYFGDQWYTQVYCNPQNYTLRLDIWYPWDDKPSASRDFEILWYAPHIIVVESEFERNGFNLEIRVEKVNASLSTDNPFLAIESGSQVFIADGTLIYESTTGSYQIWLFTSPWLTPNVWNYNLTVFDIYGHSSQFFGIFNSTDSPPKIGASSLVILDNTSTGILYRLNVQVFDDFDGIEAFLYINGVEFPFTQINNSYVSVDFFLTQGSYVLQLSVIDDINQETTEFLTNLYVQSPIDQTTTTTSGTIDTTDPPDLTSQTSTRKEVNLDTGINDLIEIGIGGGLFASLVALGNTVLRKREP